MKAKLEGLVATKQRIEPSRGPVLRMINVIPNADLRLMFGLIKVVEEMGVKVEKLGYGDCFVFVNSAGKYVKVLVGNNTRNPILACYHMPKGQRFPLEACSDIARAFRYPKKINAPLALQAAMKSYYSKSYKERMKERH